MDSLVAFIGKFVFVFLLGKQTIYVVSGKKAHAFLCSLCIGIAEILVIKAVITATESGDWMVYAMAILGGSLGIVAAILTRRP